MRVCFKIFLTLIIFFGVSVAETFSDSFYNIQDIEQRKKEFIQTLTPLVQKANENILKERLVVDYFFDKVDKVGIDSINVQDRVVIEALAKKYRIDSIENEEIFKRRIAPIPVSLAVAQAALESGWGTSRFTKEANNIFGQWIWTTNDKLGIVPENREEGKTHRIKIYQSLQESVNDYVLNLNRHDAYRDFRELRYSDNIYLDGMSAAETMSKYSEIGDEYIGLLKNVISANDLLDLDVSNDVYIKG